MADKTLYVVSGFMRTGTSMMMKALEEGGMNAEYRQSRDEMKNRFADEHYDPNIGGVYELEREDYQDPTFPRKHEGRLIKGLNMCVPRMNVMPAIKVVFMRRDQEEIRQSYDAFFGKQLRGMGRLNERMENIIKRIKNRKDVKSLDIFWYREVVNNPRKHFELLKKHGWPINIDKAVFVVDPKYYRFRKEELTEGVM